MVQDLQDKRTFRIGLAVMLALVLVLALRSQRTVSAVLANPAMAAASADAAPAAGGGVDMVSLDRRDSLIAAAQPVARDPFSARRTAPTERPPRQIEAVATVPTLSALLFDHVNPSTQINVAGQRSGWLHQGETFQGWTVSAITSDAVTITKGGDTVVLP